MLNFALLRWFDMWIMEKCHGLASAVYLNHDAGLKHVCTFITDGICFFFSYSVYRLINIVRFDNTHTD